MKTIQKRFKKPVCCLLAGLTLLLGIYYQPVSAAMVGTESTLEAARAQRTRDDLRKMMARAEVQAELTARGIDPQEAKARIGALSDAEVIKIADEIDKLPAGAGNMAIAPPVWIVVTVLLGVVLVVYLFISAVTPPAEIEKK